METFKQAIQLFIPQRRWIVLISLFMCMTLTTIISLYFTSDGIKNYIENRAYEIYGEFDGVLYGNPGDAANYANYGLIGAIELSDTSDKISVGWMSEKMFEWGRIKLLDGKFPETENEVVVESFYINQIDPNWEIGEMRSFELGGTEYSFKLSGIVENYSYRWSGPPGGLEKGINDFPNFILSDNYQFDNANDFYAVQLEGAVSQREKELYYAFNGERDFTNSRLYSELRYNQTITTITAMFQCAVLLLSLISVSLAFSYYRSSFHSKLGIYKAIGFTDKKIIKLELIQLGIVFFVSSLLSAAFTYLLTNIFIHYTFENALFQFSWQHFIHLMFWLVLIFGIYLSITVKEVKKLLNHSPRSLLTGAIAKQFVLYKTKYMQHIKYFLRHHAGSFIKYTLILTFCIVSVFCSLFLEKESGDILDGGAENDNLSISHTGYSFIYNNNQIILGDEFIPFQYERIGKIANSPGVEAISGEPAMFDVVPLMPAEKITNNLKQFIQSHYPEDTENAQIDSQRELSSSTAMPWNEVHYQWVDDNIYEQLLNDYQLDNNAAGDNNRLMILLPLDGKLKNNDFDRLDSIILSKLTPDNTGKIQLQEWAYQLDGVAYNQDKHEDKVIFILIGDRAVQNGISDGYNTFEVVLKDTISHTEREFAAEQMLDTAAFVPESAFYDIEDDWDESAKVARYIGFIGTMNFLMVMLLVSIAIYFMIFGNFLANQQRWGIYLANGLQRGKMIGLLCTELMISYMAAVILSLLAFVIIMTGDTQFPVRYYIPDLLFGFSTVLLFLFILFTVLYLKLKAFTIHSLLR